MEVKLLARIHVIARVVLAFIFIYHGLVPKILWLSPLEITLAALHHLNASVVSPMAGILEVLLGITLLSFRGTLAPVYLSIFILIGLLLDVTVVMPGLLIEAFNPVTINLASIAIAYIVVLTQEYAQSFKKNNLP